MLFPPDIHTNAMSTNNVWHSSSILTGLYWILLSFMILIPLPTSEALLNVTKSSLAHLRLWSESTYKRFGVFEGDLGKLFWRM